MRSPFRVDEGLFLEDLQLLLPWAASEERLLQLADARGMPANDAHAIHWGVHTCLGGLRVAPTRLRANPGIGARCFTLNLVDFADASARDLWEPQLQSLCSSFGPPHERGERAEGDRPFPYAAWYFGSVRLSHVMQERFVEFNTTMLFRADGAAPPRIGG